MDFEGVLKEVVTVCDQQHIRYAVMGGLARDALGTPRSTMDVDVLVHRADSEKLHQLLTAMGYERHFHSEDFSQYRSHRYELGCVDVLHAFRSVAVGMLSRAVNRPILRGRLQVKVVQPEDLIGLKVQAIANNASRRFPDQLDIEDLMDTYRARLDWERIQQYDDLFDMGEEGRQLRARYGTTQ